MTMIIDLSILMIILSLTYMLYVVLILQLLTLVYCFTT